MLKQISDEEYEISKRSGVTSDRLPDQVVLDQNDVTTFTQYGLTTGRQLKAGMRLSRDQYAKILNNFYNTGGDAGRQSSLGGFAGFLDNLRGGGRRTGRDAFNAYFNQLAPEKRAIGFRDKDIQKGGFRQFLRRGRGAVNFGFCPDCG